MFIAGGDEIKPRGLYRCMAEHIGKLGKVMRGFVIGAGKKVAQIMWEYLARFDIGEGAKGFHLAPDLFSRERGAIAREEERPAGDALAAGIFGELAGKLAGQEDGADLALEGDGHTPLGCGFQGDVAQLGDTDAGGADGLEDECEAVLAIGFSGGDESLILVAGQVAAGVAEELALQAQVLDLAVALADVLKPPADGGELGVDGGRLIAASDEGRFPAGDGRLGERGIGEPDCEQVQVAAIFVNGGSAALFFCLKGSKFFDLSGRDRHDTHSPFSLFLLCYNNLK